MAKSRLILVARRKFCTQRQLLVIDKVRRLSYVRIRKLDLRKQYLTSNELAVISSIVTKSMGITHLDLSRNALGPNASRHIASILRSCPSITSLDISWCDLGDKGVSSLCESLLGMEGSGWGGGERKDEINIRTIKLIGNRLSDVGALSLITLAKKFKDLCRIEIEELRLLRRPKIGAIVYVRHQRHSGHESGVDGSRWEDGKVVSFDESKGILVETTEGATKRRVWAQEVSIRYNYVSARLMRKLVKALRINVAATNERQQQQEEGIYDDEGKIDRKQYSMRPTPISKAEENRTDEEDSLRFIA